MIRSIPTGDLRKIQRKERHISVLLMGNGSEPMKTKSTMSSVYSDFKLLSTVVLLFPFVSFYGCFLVHHPLLTDGVPNKKAFSHYY